MADMMFARMHYIVTRLLAAALLAAISLHVTAPVPAYEHNRGSAFSAATVDVAVLAHPRAAERMVAPLPDPAGPPQIIADQLDLDFAAGEHPILKPRSWSQAPPLRSVRERPAQPRAPPYS